MAEDSNNCINHDDVLKPFYQRASEAEERLSKLEAALARGGSAASEIHLEKISQLESELKCSKEEREKLSKEVEKLAVENAKLNYRMVHLVRAVKEFDRRSEGH